MLEEHIRKDTLIKLYFSKQLLEDYENEEKSLICRGRISQVFSDSEVEIISEDYVEEDFQKNVCYMMYVFLPQDVLMCSCYFKSVYTEENRQMVTLELVSPFEHVQRRRHQRVSCHSKIRYQQLSREEAVHFRDSAELFENLKKQREAYEDSLVDISGGGIRFTSKYSVPVDSYLFVGFEIINEKRAVEMQVTGQVVYSKPHRNEQECFDIRMKYIGLTEEEREQIIHFVFQLERDSINVRWQRGGGLS